MKNGLVIDENGNKRWYKDDELHREDGPAVECVNGHKEWLKDGERHRVDGPAMEYVDGDKFWFQNGLIHRDDGPAIERPDGHNEYSLFGLFVEEEVFLNLPRNNEGKINSEIPFKFEDSNVCFYIINGEKLFHEEYLCWKLKKELLESNKIIKIKV